MSSYSARKVTVEIQRGGKTELKTFIVGAYSNEEAVLKIETALKSRFVVYQFISVASLNVAEARLSKKELRLAARRVTHSEKRSKNTMTAKRLFAITPSTSTSTTTISIPRLLKNPELHNAGAAKIQGC